MPLSTAHKMTCTWHAGTPTTEAVVRPLLQVIGSAIALLLLSQGAIPLWAGVLLSVAGSFIMLLVERWGVSTLEALFGALISIMVASFAVSWNCQYELSVSGCVACRQHGGIVQDRAGQSLCPATKC